MTMNRDLLVGKIYDDIQNALAVIDATHNYSTVEVTEVAVRVGERSDHLKNESDLSPDPFSSTNGWILDFTFTPLKDAKEVVSLLHKVVDLPLESVKGIGETWAKKLRARGLHTIGDLGDLQWDDFQKLAIDLDTVLVFEWCHAVQVLQRKAPQRMFQQCSGKSIDELLYSLSQEQFPQASLKDMTAFTALITGFSAVLDREVLSTIIL